MKLDIGLNIQLEKQPEREGEEVVLYKSRVVDIQSKDAVLIDYPINLTTGKTAFLLEGTELSAIFVDDKQHTYAFRTKVQARVRGQIPMIQISYPGDEHLKKIQRREYVRVETSVDISLEKESGEKFHLVTNDISAGGVSINMKNHYDEIEEGEIVNLAFVLAFNGEPIEYGICDAKVVRKWEDEGRKIASFVFVDIEDKLRQQIVKFCFERQLIQRNERLGII